MAKASSRSLITVLVTILPALSALSLLMTTACATADGRRVARTTPQSDADASSGAREARPTGEAESAPVQEPARPEARAGSPESKPENQGPVGIIIARAREEYDHGVQALQSGDPEEARERFDRAVEIFLNSSITVDEDRRLRHAYEKMVDDIAALESQFEGAPANVPDAEPSPTEELKDITTYMTPEEASKELAKVEPETHEVSFDIPMVINDKVLAWIDIFKNTKSFRQSFIGGYQRYGWYEEMIHSTLKEEGLPADLIYMAFLESTYKTSAYSRARAKGIWQFMTPTGRQYGLKVTRYIDERSHPEKSTRAAARYMKDLYATLGDWHLAIAAYNTGAGNILRAQRRSGKTNYWDLTRTRYMRTETKNFVPAILALALMSKDPAKYGFGDLTRNPSLEYDRVTVDGPTDMRLIARLAGCTVDEVRFLNPHLRLGVTPPGENAYEVLVPAGRGGAFTMAFAALPQSERVARLAKVHTVRRGETLASIAARYGTSVGELKAANNIRNPRSIQVGRRLTVPSLSDEPERPAATRHSPYHIVRRGDTLSAISRAYGISLRTLLAWNGLEESSILRPGMRLIVARSAAPKAASTGPVSPGVAIAGTVSPDTGSAEATSSPAGAVSVPGGGEAQPDPAGEKIVYRVRSGDNLFRIALKYRTTVDDLRAWNNLTGDSIRAGSLLTIYPN